MFEKLTKEAEIKEEELHKLRQKFNSTERDKI